MDPAWLSSYSVSMHTVSTLDTDEYWRFLDRFGTASYQQTPEWGAARGRDWDHEPLGIRDASGRLVGAALVRYRRLPGLGLRFAFIAQGPLLDWAAADSPKQLQALVGHLRSSDVFAVRIAPPVTLRRWSAATVRAGLAAPGITRFTDLRPDHVSSTATGLVDGLRELGWTEVHDDPEAEGSQPRLNFHLRLDSGSDEAVLAGMTKTWRKNIRKAARAGVEVRSGSDDDLDEVQLICAETARRGRFAPQPREYFEAMLSTLGTDFPGRFSFDVARHEGTAVAVGGTAQVGRRAQGVFAATSAQRPHVKPSNALYWEIIRRAIADGAEVFDIGGVDDVLDEAVPASGLVRFKADMGADAHEYVGVWDLPLRPAVYAGFSALLRLRAGLRTGLNDGAVRRHLTGRGASAPLFPAASRTARRGHHTADTPRQSGAAVSEIVRE